MSTATRQNISAAAVAQAWQRLDADPAFARREAEAWLASAPGHAEATLLLAAARRRQGDTKGARECLAPVIAAGSTNPVAWFEWGQILAESDDQADSVAALERAAALAPGFVGAWRALGDLLMMLGSGVAAGQAYACATRAGVRDARLLAAAQALSVGRAQDAEALLRRHVLHGPTDIAAWHLLAEAAMRMGKAAEAEAILHRCVHAAPGFAEARHSLAILLAGQQRFAEAAPHMRHLLDLMPHQPGLRVLLAVCLAKTGDFPAAIGLYEAMLAASPAWRKIWFKYGEALKALGREAEAAHAFRTYIGLAPQQAAPAYLALGDMKTVPFTPAEIEAARRLLSGATLGGEAAAQLHYALGHALEQRQDHAAAFEHFAAGAALRRAATGYDAGAIGTFLAAAQSMFDAPYLAARAGAGCQSRAPIFVVGLPRSGTTLVEQILASHTWVEGASELEAIGQIASELRGGRPMSDLPAIVGGLDNATRTALGERYMDETRQFRRLGRDYFVDKMPENYLHIGLIHAILPNARIIDVRRAPMAAGWALFRQYFRPQENGPNYSYNLAEIGHYYRDYAALVDHFAALLPGTVHRLRYEDLVTDTEAQVRALLDHCGLPFEAACLRFWETDRPVQTPSAQQVRRPIFRDGLEQWRNYEPWLDELKAALA